MTNQDTERLEAIAATYKERLTELELELFRVEQHRIGRCPVWRYRDGEPVAPIEGVVRGKCSNCGATAYMDRDSYIDLKKRVARGRQLTTRALRDVAASLRRPMPLF